MKLTAPPLVDNYDIERRVAVEVMGLPEIPWGDRTPCPYCGAVGRSGMGRIYCCNCSAWYYHPYKSYRDNLNESFEVMERMQVLGWHVTMSDQDERASHKWFVEFTSSDDKLLLTGWGDADSLSEAICEAALEAVTSG